jgi:hypothetical protein
MRKANNMQARMQRSLSAVLRTNHVCVINIDPSGKQDMINYKNCKNVPLLCVTTRTNGLCTLPDCALTKPETAI